MAHDNTHRDYAGDAWSLVPGKPLITRHARLLPGHTSDAVLARMKQALAECIHIDHSTIQIEGARADDENQRDHPGPGSGMHSHEHGREHAHGRKVAATR